MEKFDAKWETIYIILCLSILKSLKNGLFQNFLISAKEC